MNRSDTEKLFLSENSEMLRPLETRYKVLFKKDLKVYYNKSPLSALRTIFW